MMYLLLANQQRQSTEENIKHWPQPVAWPHPFFICLQSPDERAQLPYSGSPLPVSGRVSSTKILVESFGSCSL